MIKKIHPSIIIQKWIFLFLVHVCAFVKAGNGSGFTVSGGAVLYFSDSVVSKVSQEKTAIYVVENTIITGLDKSVVKIIRKKTTPSKLKLTSPHKLQEKFVVKEKKQPDINRKSSVSIFPSDIFFGSGAWKFFPQFVVSSIQFSFKKNIAVKAYNILVINKYLSHPIDFPSKDVLLFIIFIFLTVFRLRPPPYSKGTIT
ncbi:hypothetical protein [Chryseobacterium oryctis]|uniref:Uncharacterized protein n=1 Tax=Chryseobacterium oryctis TaxID=2952618 RepID=A0ABT3HM19_9FLAO|nr:hypothetical protein [Chryseobacterium oryctis]MCW3160837.1 hypothetical protein [Chryseobacterium oryctis]